ncbi:MAG TPA: hypothetical protein VFJ98_07380 [Mycobacteriales bacterium]|nr:hypothetical protein [Mycobacteriales bacterium]
MNTDNHGTEADARPGRSRLHRWNRLNLRFFGPPHVGRYDGPYPEIDPDPACPFCGNPESAHETFRTAEAKTLRRCPPRS